MPAQFAAKPAKSPEAPASPTVTKVRVVAMETGYYGHSLRHPGIPFIVTLTGDETIPSWTKREEDVAKEEAEKLAAELRVDTREEPISFSELNRRDHGFRPNL